MRHFLRLAILLWVICLLSAGQIFSQVLPELPEQLKMLEKGFVASVFQNLYLGVADQRVTGLLTSGGIYEDTDCDSIPGSSMISGIQFWWNQVSSPVLNRAHLNRFHGNKSVDELVEFIDSLGQAGKMFVNGNQDINAFINTGLSLCYGTTISDIPFSISTASPISRTITVEFNATWKGVVLPLAIQSFISEDDGFGGLVFKDYLVNENAVRLPAPPADFWKLSCEEDDTLCRPPACEYDPEDSDSVHSFNCYFLKDFHDYLENNFLNREIQVNISRFDPNPITLQLNFRDRTPPRFLDESNNEFDHFPDCSGATTGDFFSFRQITVRDNSGGPIKTLVALGYVNPTRDFNPQNWEAYEEWQWSDKEPHSNSGGPLTHVIMPHECHGRMRYSIFAWDKHNNLNPGEPAIIEDEPEKCYGLSPTNGNDYGYLSEESDLSRDPLSARPFPRTIDSDGAFPPTFVDSKANKSPLDPARRIGGAEGNLLIWDNDYPNLMIKIRPVLKNEPAMFFPPPSEIEEPFFNTEFEDDYREYISDAMFTASYAHVFKEPYYPQIIDIKLANCPAGEKSWMSKWGVDPGTGPIPEDPDFIKKSFRMEHYLYSDTTPAGDLIGADEKSFGFRNGYGSDVVVFSSVPLIEDLEYEISLYMEDNIKWINTSTRQEKLLSGIDIGSYTIVIPNQAPPVRIERLLDRFCHPFTDPIKVVFREPVDPPKRQLDYENLQKHYPYVQASVSDVAGNNRTITVFFTVSDEKTKITTIERRLNKNDD